IAPTTAKIAMQIAVTNQKTKSIRSASFDDWSGSQGTKIATAVASAANTSETRRTLIRDPARTAREPTELVAGLERVHRRWLRRASARRTAKRRHRMGLGVSLLLIAVGA